MFGLLLFIHLIPICIGKYFLTVDGPCHLYNSQVLSDILLGKHVDFYETFYQLNDHLNPNWFSHALMSLLLIFLPAFLVEKIVLIAYVLGFAIGFRRLVKLLMPKQWILPYFGFLFIYNSLFLFGFYNFSFSLVWLIWIAVYYLKYENRLGTRQYLILSFLALIQYFTHPIGLLLSIGILLCWSCLNILKDRTKGNDIVKLFLSFSPSLLLLGLYLNSSQGGVWKNDYSFEKLFKMFFQNKVLVSLSDFEYILAAATGILILLLLMLGFCKKYKRASLHKADVFIALSIFCLFMFFFGPKGLAGGGILLPRMHLLVLFFAVLYLAQFDFKKKVEFTVFGILIFLIIGFWSVRIPKHIQVNKALNEYLSASQFIKPNATVLALSFAHAGKTLDGNEIASRQSLFLHAASYLGTEKPLIIFDNYEANTGHFPLNWKEHVNPFKQIGYGIESEPPKADFINYVEKTGQEIEYVLIWGLDQEYQDHENTKEIFKQLELGYQKLHENDFMKVYGLK